MDVFRPKVPGTVLCRAGQNSYMCRLRIPNGIMTSVSQDVSPGSPADLGGGFADLTTATANLQIREIGAETPLLLGRARISA